MSASTKGIERQAFVEGFLANVFPPTYRFGQGDATDVSGKRSGQLDVVVEYPFGPSLPLVGGSARLYLAESVAAVVEVKSNVASQWTEVLGTASALAPLSRKFGATMIMGQAPQLTIPLFAVGYKGWSTAEAVARYLSQTPTVAGILVIESGLFAMQPAYGGLTVQGEAEALWGLVCGIHLVTSGLRAASTDPTEYL